MGVSRLALAARGPRNLARRRWRVDLDPVGGLPTRHPAEASFGRVYAAYGGFFVVLSLAWGWWIDSVRPDRWELLGGALALIGVAVIMYAPRD